MQWAVLDLSSGLVLGSNMLERAITFGNTQSSQLLGEALPVPPLAPLPELADV